MKMIPFSDNFSIMYECANVHTHEMKQDEENLLNQQNFHENEKLHQIKTINY